MLVFYNELKSPLKSIDEYFFNSFTCKDPRPGSWNCFRAVVSYGSDPGKVQSVCDFKHGPSNYRSCNRCLGTLEEFLTMTSSHVWHRSHSAVVREKVKE